MKIGIIREGKVPPDLRVALSPKQCKALLTMYPHVRLVVEESPIRTFSETKNHFQPLLNLAIRK